MARLLLCETYIDNVSDEYLVFKQLDLLVKDPDSIYELLPKNCQAVYGRLVVMIAVEPVDFVKKKRPPPKRRL